MSSNVADFNKVLLKKKKTIEPPDPELKGTLLYDQQYALGWIENICISPSTADAFTIEEANYSLSAGLDAQYMFDELKDATVEKIKDTTVFPFFTINHIANYSDRDPGVVLDTLSRIGNYMVAIDTQFDRDKFLLVHDWSEVVIVMKADDGSAVLVTIKSK